MLEQRAILETLRDGLIVADADGTVVFANRAACSLLSQPREALERRGVTAVLAERLRGPDGVSPAQLPEANEIHSSARRLAALRPDGRTLPVELVVDQGEVDGRRVAVFTLRSVPERAALESRLVITDALAAMADAFVQMTARPEVASVARVVVDTLVARLGAAGARLWLLDGTRKALELAAWAGIPPEVDGASSLGEGGAERYGLGLADVLAQPHARAGTVGEPGVPAWFADQGLVGWVLHPLVFGEVMVGVIAYLSREAVPREFLPLLGAFARHAAVALHDVSEQVRARHQIEALATEARARMGEFETILSNMPDAVFVVRGDRIKFANRTAAKMLGVDDPHELELPLDRFASLSPVRDQDGTMVTADTMPLARVLRGETVTGAEGRMTNLRTGREIWLQISGAPLRDADGTIQGGVVVATEITRLKELEHSKDEWLAIAAHELRTPLTPITVHLQMAQRRLHMGRPISPEVFDKALEQVKRLARLVNGLLDVTRLQAGQLDFALEDVDVREVAEAIVERVRHGAPAHTLVLDVDARPVVVRGDRARLDEVLAALVDNAIKYSPNGGEVWVRVRAGADGAARVDVKDQGIGIAASERAQIFERYFRAGSVPHTQYGGLGLGLWIAGKVVARHGGHIELESTPGAGSTFTVVLPLAHAVASEPQPTTAEGEVAPRARVMVVDDDAGVLEAFEGLLDEDGYDVRLARSGPEALARAREWRPDVVLLDLRMPGMDGWEVRRRFAADPLLADVPVVLVSADRDARIRASGMNVQGFVAKPFDVDEIERVLQGILPGRGGPGEPASRRAMA